MAIAVGTKKTEGSASQLPKERGESFEERLRLRQEAAQAAIRAAEVTEGGIGAVQEATVAGRDFIRQQAAQALAASQGLATPAGGARTALARGTALQEGVRGAAFEAGQAGQEVEARQAAALAQLESAKFQTEQGSLTGQRQEKVADFRLQINAILDRNEGVFGTDEEAAAREIQALAEFEDDPVIRDFLLKEADRIRKS